METVQQIQILHTHTNLGRRLGNYQITQSQYHKISIYNKSRN